MTDRDKIATLDTSFAAIPLVEAIDLDKSEIFVDVPKTKIVKQ